MSILVNLLNGLIFLLGSVLNILLSIFPDSPFQAFINGDGIISEYLGYLNYFFPVSEIIFVLQAWVAVVGIIYIYMIVGRWLKVFAS